MVWLRLRTGYAMTRYLKLDDQGAIETYPYTRAGFKSDYPNVSIPNPVLPEHLASFPLIKPVTEVTRPDDTVDDRYVEGTPVESPPGTWTQVWDAVAKTDAEKLQDRYGTEKAAVIADSFVPTFIAMTPQEVSDYIDANVTDLALARSVINKMAKMLLLLARREFS